MGRKKPSIRNIDQLDKEVLRLKLRARKIEDRLDDNIRYVQENFFHVVRQSIFPSKHQSGLGSLINLLMDHDSIIAAVKKMASRFTGKAETSSDKDSGSPKG
ncbi:MAG: hypothetical protein RL732_695 [Bacteroidota bacterium]|jgi:hypothetical protein